MSTDSVSGSCLCGEVRFEAGLPSNWVAHCYCSLCRRAHGAGFVTWVSVPSEHFRIIAGDEFLTEYQSSAEAKRRFCSRCGSTLLFQSTRWPGETHVVLANFDTAVDRAPHVNAFVDDKAGWVELQHLAESDG